MSPASPAEWYSYAVVRIVPRVERGEFLNVGIILFVRSSRLLCCRLAADWKRLQLLDPAADIEELQDHLELMEAICEADNRGGPISELPADERFHWLTAPRSTILQVSAVHEGTTEKIESTLDALFKRYVGTPNER
jgi:hypothetical protein